MSPSISRSPNLFAHAAKELSLDAFLCWFLSWANSEYTRMDAGLHEGALVLLNRLLSLGGFADRATAKIDLHAQQDRVDVLALIDEDVAVLLENKAGTTEHDDQLSRYLESVKRRYPNRTCIPVYFQAHEQASYVEVERAGYERLQRVDVLEAVDCAIGAGSANSVALDFRAWLGGIEAEVTTFAAKIVQDWGWFGWQGFFIRLQAELGEGEWGWVPQPKSPGGFWGFWWASYAFGSYPVYLQLEDEKLCFKIEVAEKSERTRARDSWRERLKAVAASNGLTLTSPRMGNGRWMTVAQWPEPYIAVKQEGIIDLNQTCACLGRARKLLEAGV